MDARDESLEAPLHVGSVSAGGGSLRMHQTTTAHRLFDKLSGQTQSWLQTSAVLFGIPCRNLQEVGLTVAFQAHPLDPDTI